MPLRVIVNGNPREFGALEDGVPLTTLVDAMALKADRVAIERNGEIVPRRSWAEVSVATGDKLEIVHFVGGGSAPMDSLLTRHEFSNKPGKGVIGGELTDAARWALIEYLKSM